jgi:hypothetical protein
MINQYKYLFGKPEGKRAFRTAGCKRTVKLLEIGLEVMKWINLAHNRDVMKK